MNVNDNNNDNDNINDNKNVNDIVSVYNQSVYNQCEHLNEDQAKSDVLYDRYINKITKVLN